ncbi:inositol-1-monophosphatase [Pelagibaculum spongiae]|uniref:Inositol-1-monophosphatase n=1 Tax=Pelagibaculum spongiae TaxID=2080658 RepID=A0A2V1H6G8_9GAMM|nr:inositol-1-monophosphatase [Pelagibaculum spongiae]PVZ72355.1 inositol-1-monophosphatase [Pelagibaculum spongiae]
MHPMQNIAIRAARSAGRIVSIAYGQLDNITAEQKGTNDFVSDVDRRAEQDIIQAISKAYPEHGILAEESGMRPGKGDGADYLWVIDPLDGSNNFLRGIPHFAVSIALKVKGRIEQAVVYDPIKDELFTASRGRGASKDGRRIRVSDRRELEGGILATGLPFKQPGQLHSYMSTFNSLVPKIADIRRSGSAALDLAYVAAGRIDGYWEMTLNEWDVAAGCLLVTEAGGLVSDFSGGNRHLETGSIVASNPKLMRHILPAVKKAVPAE